MSKENTINRKNSFWNMHLTAIITLSLVLFLVGFVSLLYFLANDMSRYMRENITMSIVLTDSADVAYVQSIEKLLTDGGYAKELKYISKDDALKEHIAAMGEDPAAFLGFNPLLASIEVKLNPQYANTENVTVIEQKLKHFSKIDKVAYQKDAMDLVNANINRIGIMLAVVGLILCFVSIVLINSTIRLMIYADRFLIKSMRLVGATSWFIRKPYIGRSMLDGFIAALLAIFYLAAFVYYLQQNFELNIVHNQPITLAIVAGVVAGAGVVLTAILAFFAVGRYLKMKSDKMYLV